MSTTAEPGSFLQQHLDQMVEAGFREGILPDSPLGQWQEAVVLLTRDFDRDLKAVVGEARAAAQASAAMANAASHKAESMVRHAEIQTEQVLAQTVEQLTPAVAKALGEAVVIRERRWNRQRHAMTATAVAAVLLGVFVAGYVVRGFQDGPNAELVQRCIRASVKDAAGNTYCNIMALRDPVGQGMGARRP
ncbi:hypothetical protein ACFQY5_40040 [Paeniroseomonas aquatica]|uniref:Uncharacterized protein n=1 Tax=Paeniroseomonas aquatica TaxID=373043 RepID=A0ABT8A067_9PROT|nr:hypothetical protein [Paeniroseomonas aquatica]MDN3563115.1 hypothetical protein [Paeniroseomonas aquatica]